MDIDEGTLKQAYEEGYNTARAEMELKIMVLFSIGKLSLEQYDSLMGR